MGHILSAVLVQKVEVSWFLMGDLKSKRIGRAYCEYGAKGGFRALAVKVWSWSCAPSRLCESWRGSSDCAWSGGFQKLLLWGLYSCELSKSSHGSSPPLLGNCVVCVQQCRGLQCCTFRKGLLIPRELPAWPSLICGGVGTVQHHTVNITQAVDWKNTQKYSMFP